MAKFKCKVCGYVYDEDNGEKRRDLAAGTKWDDVPDTFKCPSCGAPKKSFVAI
ncbi:rubredoxin [Methanobrevibacter curvatus]|uniref:Rubredoxin n=1 Tax=Methanobrevibacter curvatus TaxID=49547 RepID=A0A162FFL4_9EURY|nr:rubredoxin [Methanobrevibacter curvatus]KZX12365.1 rubredoxin [Methanobrevibacter curvatus]